MLTIGVDVGTFETKAVAIGERGEIVARSTRGHRVITPRPGWVEHDATETWWGGLVAVVRDLLVNGNVLASNVAAICCSGIGPCVLPVDDLGRPLRNAILYGVDTRATAEVEQLNDLIGESEIWKRTGNRLSSQSAGPKIAWLRNNEPDVHGATGKFVTCQSFLVAKLTGRWVIDHATAGYFHPLYDLTKQAWDLSGCEHFVTEGQLPKLAWAGEVAGGITRRAAEETGLRMGTRVLVGTADAPAEALSAGIAQPHQMMLMYGSSHFFIEVLSEPTPFESLYSAPFLFEGSFVLAAGTATAGTITRWFVDLLGWSQSTDGEAFARLAAEAAESPPGANGVLALPHFSGERTPFDDPNATGALFGLRLGHTRADVYRALLEGIGQGVRHVFQTYRMAGAEPRVIRSVGGGTRNPVWLSAISDITGRTQAVVRGNGASYGDAMLAALALDSSLSLRDICGWVDVDHEVRPAAEFTHMYEEQGRTWDALRAATAGIPTTARKALDLK